MDVLLDLLNSRPLVDGKERDALGDPAEGRQWAREHGGEGSPAELALLRETRDVLRDVVLGRRSPVAFGPLLEGVHRTPEMTSDGLRWLLRTAPHARLAAEVVLAWADTEEQLPGRLRPCANDGCRLFLLDRSRANRARWCSMAVCGNREKARRHYERTR
ncbi:CGNR zinc finger domain-containing protein [Streptomyces sp. NPDC053741]|uniref:CGNR zinc finger domain-containing protein n=1 Tax=Streptomyces TaxID=1883 RepID=UPI0029A79D86|nr:MULTISPECIES: CGNR zinc finger domain-containing protein [unclassified Streptomyces]MDX3180962.1 CGNR zinc finger domain-containing protein [Streptomyces sp. ME02-7008A-1]MDX3301703.1 CGNR zinc finger domain-containing protein [Streptomyces sp. ME02-7008A]